MWQCFKRKRAEEEIKYLSFHDKLTGLYNRAFFEEEIKRLDTENQLPVSLIIGDVNGLKLANDVFGHQEGDRLLQKIADILKHSCRKQDTIVRWGGDEFAIILPNTPLNEAHTVCERIKEACSKADRSTIQPSIALGAAVKNDLSKEFEQVLKEAEDRMYRLKLQESKNTRSAIISSLEKTMFERRFETKEHTKRMSEYSLMVGQALGLSQNEADDLHLLTILHDIGIIAITDKILVKPGKLTAREWEEIKKHPVDAFDVMTHERPYRKAVSCQEALEEIRNCSGTQFDPEIAEIFLNIITSTIQS